MEIWKAVQIALLSAWKSKKTSRFRRHLLGIRQSEADIGSICMEFENSGSESGKSKQYRPDFRMALRRG